MEDRDNRPTTPTPSSRVARAHPVAGWTALFAVIPAIIMAWQSGDKADSAKVQAADVSAKGYELTDRTWRYTRRVLDRQAEDIDECFGRVEELEEAMEWMQNLGDTKPSGRRPPRNRPPVHTSEARPAYTAPADRRHTSQMELPEKLADLPRLD